MTLDIHELLMGEDRVKFIHVGNEVLRLDLEELQGEFLEKSQRDLRESPETVKEGLDNLKTLLKDEDGLSIPLDDDSYLIKFLRPNKFYAESAFKMMRNYYKFKVKHPRYCADLKPKSLFPVFQNNIVNILPLRAVGGERILILHAGKQWNPSKISVNELFRALVMMLEIAMLEPKTQVGGVHVIIDLKGLSLTHVVQFSPSFAKAVLTFVQECMPIRLKGIHIVNQPYIFNMLYAIFKPFIGEKLRRRLQFVGTNWNTLHEKISADYLPSNYNGKLKIDVYPGELMGELLCEYEKEFEFCETIGYNKEVEVVEK